MLVMLIERRFRVRWDFNDKGIERFGGGWKPFVMRWAGESDIVKKRLQKQTETWILSLEKTKKYRKKKEKRKIKFEN